MGRAFTVPMHISLTSPLCPLNVLRVHKQKRIPDKYAWVSPGFHTHANPRVEVSSPAPLSLKVPQKMKPPPQPGPLMELLHQERCCITRALSTCLSKSPETNPPSRFPLQSPYRKGDVPSPEPSICNSQSPQKRNPPPGFPYRAPT
jgi:hypothetical protein